jgi:multiple antibiotic resistance protein
MEEIKTLSSAFLLTFGALFPIVNPIEGAPFYHALTRDLTAGRQVLLTRRISVNAFFLLLGSMLVGPWLLDFFGIELPVVRIAGGLVLTTLGWKLLTQERWSDHAAGDVSGTAFERSGDFYPLTMPLTVGPGSMSVAISIGSHRPSGLANFASYAFSAFGAVCGIFAIALSIFIAYRFSSNLSRVLGATGIEVVVRLSAFLLLCLGIEFLWSGYLALRALHPA